jgi:hypothetical protein
MTARVERDERDPGHRHEKGCDGRCCCNCQYLDLYLIRGHSINETEVSLHRFDKIVTCNSQATPVLHLEPSGVRSIA